MHDAVAGDRFSIPSAGIMTEQFVSAAQLMAQVLGAEGYDFVTIEHPISSASAQQLHERAIVAVNASARILLNPDRQDP